MKPHKTSKQEINGLLTIVERELKDAQVEGISTDGKFNHAYRASLTLATILLYTSGYAVGKGESSHYRTIDAIPLTLGEDAKEDRDYLNTCRAKRNAAEYDAANEASEAEADEMLEFAKEFQSRIDVWLKTKTR